MDTIQHVKGNHDCCGQQACMFQLYCCHTRLQYLADGAVHDLDYLPYLVALVPFGKIAPSFSIASNKTTRASSQRRRLISSRAMQISIAANTGLLKIFVIVACFPYFPAHSTIA